MSNKNHELEQLAEALRAELAEAKKALEDISTRYESELKAEVQKERALWEQIVDRPACRACGTPVR